MNEEYSCKRCEAPMSMSDDTETEFVDENTGAALIVMMRAAWCDSCGYSHVVVI